MKTKHTLCVAAAAMLLATSGWAGTAACATGANLVANCGFETGDFSGWTLTGADVPGQEGNLYGVEGVDPLLPNTAPHSGDWQAYFGDLDARATTLTQTLATTAGEAYAISFELADVSAGGGSPAGSQVTVSFDGNLVGGLTDVSEGGYSEYTFSGISTGSSTVFSLSLGADVDEFLLDDVSVTAVALTVPEPSTFSLTGLGALALVAGLVRRRRGLRA